MKQMRVLLPLLLSCACATAPQTASTPQSVPYELALAGVEHQPRGGTRTHHEPAAANTFEDERIRIAWTPEATQLQFELTNKSDASMRVLWDDASFVDVSGRGDRVMHQGVKFADRSSSMPPTLIVHGATLDDLIAPVTNVYWREGYGAYDAGRWQSKPLIPEGMKATGKMLRVLLPLESNGTVHEYLFDFAVREGTMPLAAAEPASAIKIVRKREEVEGCEMLGEIAAHPPYIWPGDDFRQLRSKGAALGADTVLVPGRRIGSVEGIAYRCRR
ncbi:MAG TPA: hypothetical protein VEK11_23475 [Thermoanaerobaculia bacterium]|jgi:hypothetical protein|nr:hypothetical protein [Thermoanaerobaculia bacterium]